MTIYMTRTSAPGRYVLWSNLVDDKSGLHEMARVLGLDFGFSMAAGAPAWSLFYALRSDAQASAASTLGAILIPREDFGVLYQAAQVAWRKSEDLWLGADDPPKVGEYHPRDESIQPSQMLDRGVQIGDNNAQSNRFNQFVRTLDSARPRW